MPHLLLAGYFGCGNLGDDAIMLGFVQGLTQDFDITLMSGQPEASFRNYNIRSIPRKDVGHFKAEIERCDAVVFPGGSIFQDVTSAASVGYYAQICAAAKKAGKKLFLVGQGVGPVNGMFAKGWARSAFNAADAIVVRDPMSPATLKAIGVNRPVQIGADSAFLLPEPPVREDGTSFGVGNMKTVGISPRPYGRNNKECVKVFGDLARLLSQNNMVPVMVEMDSQHDGPLILEIGKQMGGKVPDIRKLETPIQLQSRLARLDSIIAMRLHAGILGATVGIPAMMLNYDPKVAAFAKIMGFESPLGLDGLTGQRIFDTFMQFRRDRDRYAKMVQQKSEEQRKLAQINVQVVLDAFGKG